MKSLHALVATAALIGASTISFAALAQSASAPTGETQMDKPATAGDMTEGEIRKVDKDTKKITIKHGEIKNLDMPAMTMTFRAADPKLLDNVKEGDKIKFNADKIGGQFTVTGIEKK